jgi:hypothetical protein
VIQSGWPPSQPISESLGVAFLRAGGTGVVGAVEARTFEGYASNAKYLDQFALAAVWAFGEGSIAKGLLNIKLVFAVLASV